MRSAIEISKCRGEWRTSLSRSFKKAGKFASQQFVRRYFPIVSGENIHFLHHLSFPSRSSSLSYSSFPLWFGWDSRQPKLWILENNLQISKSEYGEISRYCNIPILYSRLLPSGDATEKCNFHRRLRNFCSVLKRVASELEIYFFQYSIVGWRSLKAMFF